MKKVLIITWDMMPFTKVWGNCQRMYFLADYLSDMGDCVDVICAYNSKDINGGDCEIPFNVLAFDFYGRRRKPARKENNIKKNPKKDMIRNLLILIADVFARLVNMFYNESNYRNSLKVLLWTLQNRKNIRNQLEEKTYDSIIISGPPHTLFREVNLARRYGTNVILDYRDPWNLWRKKYPLSCVIEKSVIKQADKIVFTNDNVRLDTIAKYKIDPSKTEVVANGYSKKMWNSAFEQGKLEKSSESDIFKIAYVGGIGINNRAEYRDCTNLVLAYKKFKLNKNCRLKIIGVTDIKERDIELYHADGIELKGQITEIESFKEMVNADVLVILHIPKDDSGKYIVSAKLYDYMASGSCILSIGNKGDLHQELVENNRLGVFSVNSQKEIMNKLDFLYGLWKEDKLLKRDSNNITNLELFSRENQYANYRKLL